jgi:Holliday junction resolvase
MNQEEDQEVDDIFSPKKKKKINSSVKGKTNEREIVKILNKRFAPLLSNNPSWGMFARTMGSGNRFSQVCLSYNAKQVFSSDISCPPPFKFTIESKGGYDIDLSSAFSGNKELDAFLKQATEDGEKSNKIPMVLWKKNRRPRLAFLQSSVLRTRPEYYMIYREWTALLLEDLLKESDDFFFDTKQP